MTPVNTDRAITTRTAGAATAIPQRRIITGADIKRSSSTAIEHPQQQGLVKSAFHAPTARGVAIQKAGEPGLPNDAIGVLKEFASSGRMPAQTANMLLELIPQIGKQALSNENKGHFTRILCSVMKMKADPKVAHMLASLACNAILGRGPAPKA